jgi:hypothetical protein
MLSRDEFVAEVDALLAESKALAGIGVPGHWQPGRDNIWQRLRLPIEVTGVQHGDVALVIEFEPTRSNLVFTINLICRACVSRLDFDSTVVHTNSFLNSTEPLPPLIVGSHFHRWQINRRFADGGHRLIELNNAEPLPPTIHTFDAALRWFCDQSKIALPHDHWIQLPPRGLI